MACVHCGLCLPHCPTYTVLYDENDSPRGRLYLMRAVAAGRIDADDAYMEHMEACIGCRACETACPSGVEYEHVMQFVREDLRAKHLDPLGMLGRLLRWLGVRLLIPRRWPLRVAVWPMRILRHLRPSGGWPKALPTIVRKGLEMLPPPAPDRPRPAAVASTGTDRVVQFRGCVMDELYRSVNQATTRILKVNGCEVDLQSDQGCCGALHAHAGYREDARGLALRNIDAFDDGTDAPIVVNAAGCGAIMKEYGALLADDEAYAKRAAAFSARVRDFSEFLAERDLAKGVVVGHRAAYDAPCHLHHAQRVQQAPQDVLASAIPGFDLVPLRGTERCCGSGGIYNLTHQELAEDVLADKLDAIGESGADVVITANPGCQMQIQAGARLRGMDVRVMHVVEVIDEAYAAAGLYDK